MKKSRLSVGQNVRIKSSLKEKIPYYHGTGKIEYYYEKTMGEFLGKEATIVEVTEGGYKLDIDDLNNYTDEMLVFLADTISKSQFINPAYLGQVNVTAIKSQIAHVEKQLDSALDNKDKENFIALSEVLHELYEELEKECKHRNLDLQSIK